MSPLTPLEIVKRTPKTNCGECGHPACLAFGAAVVSKGLDLNLCPYIDTTGLPSNDLPHACSKSQDEKDLEFVEHLKSKIAPLDFSIISAKLGTTYDFDNKMLIFNYLGQTVHLSKNLILIDNQAPSDHRDQILLYNYVYSEGGSKPQNEWIGMESMPNSISKVKTLSTYCEERLAADFSIISSEHAHTIFSNLQGVASTEHSATLASIIPVLPMVPQYVLFWEEEPEDNFDAKVKVLFDTDVLTFLDIESLVFSAERMADRIHEMINITKI